MTRPRVFIPDPIHANGIARLGDAFEVDAPSSQDDAGRLQSLAAADAVVVRNLKIDAALIDASPKLKVIAKHGAGVDNIDIATATARGIIVASVPGGNADAVAEATVALMLAAMRRVPQVHQLVTTGRYSERFTLHFEQLTGRTLGLVGIGNIGARVAGICAGGFRMRVLAYDPVLSAEAIRERGAEKVEGLNEMLTVADVVSLHLPLTTATYHLIGREQIAAMKPTAILVNAARGPLIDENALADALREGRIGGAGLDVFEVEPPSSGNPLLSVPNTVLSPHTAGNSVEAARYLAIASAEIVIAALSGQKPASFLNPEVWDKRRR
jgi:D-3-phosphoglycerate dehydrogenase